MKLIYMCDNNIIFFLYFLNEFQRRDIQMPFISDSIKNNYRDYLDHGHKGVNILKFLFTYTKIQ